MFGDVAKFVVTNQSGSTSMIQRNYSIGYNRAGKIMDQLERMGVVGPQVGAKPREVLIKDPMTLESLLNNLWRIEGLKNRSWRGKRAKDTMKLNDVNWRIEKLKWLWRK